MADGVRCMIMRGGTSKGLYFDRDDLPAVEADRDALLLALMGTPDPRQIDGLGGANPLTSKVAIVAPSADGRADVDYLFLQLGVEDRMVTDRQNCGNLLAGVGPFAVERGMVDIADGPASIRIRMLNTDSVATARFEVRNGLPVYDGHTDISGVPNTAAPIRLDFEDIAGSSCGSLLPTGSPVDEIDGLRCTLVDNGMPVVVIGADSLGIDGAETCAELEADRALRDRLENIRLSAGPLMNLGDVGSTSVPKLTIVSRPRAGGTICTRTFIPHRCHDAIGVLGAVSVATASLLGGSPAAEVAGPTEDGLVRIEHPTGSFDASIQTTGTDERGTPIIERAGIVRTARKLMDGLAFPGPDR